MTYNSVVEYTSNNEFRYWCTPDSLTKLALKYVNSSSFYVVYRCFDDGTKSTKELLGSFGNPLPYQNFVKNEERKNILSRQSHSDVTL